MASAPNPDVKPAPLLHCERVYERMHQEAKEVRETDVPMLVWEGFTTQLLKNLELAVPYYSTIRRALLDMGCVKQLRRGGGTSPSQWELIKPPTMDLWMQMLQDRPDAGPGVGSVNAATKGDLKHLHQQVLDLKERVDNLEDSMKYVVDLFNESLKKGA